MMTKDELWALRQEIKLCSLFYADYRNSFGIDEHPVCDFFDGFLEYLDQEMQETIPGYDDAHFFDHLPAYDNADNLWNWYNMLETDPLPLPQEEDEELEEEAS